MPRKTSVVPVQAPAAQPHSKIGIVSFVIACVSMIVSFILVILSAVIQVRDPGYFNGEGLGVILLGLVVIFTACGAFSGMVLGIVALFEKGKNKIFSILGMVFNFMILIAWLLLMIVGSIV